MINLDSFNRQMNEVFETDVNSLNKRLVQAANEWGGKVYLVGGAVRDELMGKESKDYDYLLTKITLEDLAKKLTQIIPGAKISEVGQSFGIVKASLGKDEFDFAIPRADIDRENVKTDPNIPVEQDLMRRDFTINALAKDLETGQIISPEGQDGVSDLKNKIIRAVGNPVERFREDPLRMLRALQFASRFGFTIDDQTLKAMSELRDSLRGVSAERFYEEFNKGWTKGNADTDVFFQLLSKSGIGRVMFGEHFKPVAIETKKYGDEGFIIQAICAFLEGGDYTKVILKTDEQDIIKLSRTFREVIKTGKIDANFIKSISKMGRYFPLIVTAFGAYDSRTRGTLMSHLNDLLSKPLIPKVEAGTSNVWELPVLGGDIMKMAEELGKPLKGKAISDTILSLIGAYQSGKLKLAETDEQNKEEIKKYLSEVLLKETVVVEQQRIDSLKTRLNNILYK